MVTSLSSSLASSSCSSIFCPAVRSKTTANKTSRKAKWNQRKDLIVVRVSRTLNLNWTLKDRLRRSTLSILKIEARKHSAYVRKELRKVSVWFQGQFAFKRALGRQISQVMYVKWKWWGTFLIQDKDRQSHLITIRVISRERHDYVK